MKLLRFFIGLTAGLAFSLLASSNFLPRYAGLDVWFLILVPALAFAYALSQTSLPLRSASPAQILRYGAAFLPAVLFGYGALGFLDEVFATPPLAFLFSFFFILPVSLLFYALLPEFLRRLKEPAFAWMSALLLALLPALFWLGLQFPALLRLADVTVPRALLGLFAVSALAAGWGGCALLARAQNFYPRNGLPLLKLHLPGIFASATFFLINLILARALNHPAFSYNSVVFETDAGPWMTILASPSGDAVNRAVHPLSLLLLRPSIRLLASFFGAHWNLAALLFVAAAASATVWMTYWFIQRASGNQTYAALFAIFLGLTPAHLFFGALTENYIFGVAGLLLFALLAQSGETRLTRLVPAGVLVFGITVTNLAHSALILLFQKIGWRKLSAYLMWSIALGVALTTLANALYPRWQTFFFVPADLAFERNFVKPTYASPLDSVKEKAQVIARSMLLYQVVAPSPLAVVSQKKNDPFPTLDLKTYDWREHRFASYRGWQNLPLAAWLSLLAGAAWLAWMSRRASPHRAWLTALAAISAFNILLHFFYGTELFLYTPYWTYALILWLALAYVSLAGKRWFEIFFGVFLALLAVNQFYFLWIVFRALSPFFT